MDHSSIAGDIVTIYHAEGATILHSTQPQHNALLIEARKRIQGFTPVMDGTMVRYLCSTWPEAVMYELPQLRQRSPTSLGILYQDNSPEKERLRQFFSLTLLTKQQDNPTFDVTPLEASFYGGAEKAFTALFEERLLYQAPGSSGWQDGGREVFERAVKFFVTRNVAIKMCLPAFPCKSTSSNKTATPEPDGAEYEALLRLVDFTRAARRIYPPGCMLKIVSDGHVFSDCTGTDDQVVTDYNLDLEGMLACIYRGIENPAIDISFSDLEGFLNNYGTSYGEEARLLLASGMMPCEIEHPITTKRTASDELYRRLLLSTCAPSKNTVRDIIDDYPEHTITSLYRGFSRFMLQDLATHPDLVGKTTSQKKKIVENVALEMIVRNQAYSKLVETMLPRHIRLSIHAHDNRGPKFAIQLLKLDILPLEPLHTADQAQRCDDACQIPTPWHCAVVDLYIPGSTSATGHESTHTFVTTAGAIKQQLSTGVYYGGYVPQYHGGRFVICPTPFRFESPNPEFCVGAIETWSDTPLLNE